MSRIEITPHGGLFEAWAPDVEVLGMGPTEAEAEADCIGNARATFEELKGAPEGMLSPDALVMLERLEEWFGRSL